jgi:N4-gp56 family major capsid protein
MAVTTTSSTLEIQKWRRDFWREYQRENLFSPYMGDGQDAVIHRINELKDEGEQITLPLVGRLRGAGVSGATTLTGAEEALDNYGFKLTIDWWRHAVLLNKKEMRKSAIDQLKVVRPSLMDRAASKLRDDIILALHNVGGSTLVGNVQGKGYAAATAAERNAWTVANADRILFGNKKSNYNATHATALATITAATDKFGGSSVKLLKRIAKTADPRIRPLRVEDGKEYFIAFAGTNAFRDFSNDAEVQQANRDARERGVDSNPIFQDGDLILNGVIVREIPEMDALCTITGAGAAGINVAPVFLAGQQAVGYAVGQLPAPTQRSDDDYGFIKGRGVETCYGIGKVQYRDPVTAGNPVKDYGLVTGYFASVGDA